MQVNESIEKMSREAMSALQLKRLQKQIKWSLEKSNFYYKSLTKKGITEETVQSLSDIAKLPLTTSKDLVENSPFDFLTMPLSSVIRVARQGVKLKLKKMYTSGDLSYQIDMLTRVLVGRGINAATSVGIMAESADSRFLDIQYALENIGATVVLLGTDQDDIKSLLDDCRVDVLISNFLQVTRMIVTMQSMGVDTEKMYMPEVICMEEGLLNPNRSYIEQRLKTKNTVVYNSPSMGCAGIMFSCGEGKGFHIQEDYFYPEIVEFGSDKIIEESHVMGELVLTSLVAEAMPVLRYRTGMAVMQLDDPCPCGRTFVRIAAPVEY